MLFVLSPAKTLDYTSDSSHSVSTQPRLLTQTRQLATILKAFSVKQLAELMHLSQKLAELNAERYQSFSTPFTDKNAKPCLKVFRGDVYRGMQVDQYLKKDWDYAQKHLRILSGLYGLLRPLDLMQPYRLEMGTKLKNKKARDLYGFWGEHITQLLNEDARSSKSKVLINLASQEYFKAIRPKLLDIPVVTPVFKENKQGTLKVIALFAKRARGLMADFAIQKHLTEPEGLKAFSSEGYRFDPKKSSETEWVFVRNKKS